MLSKGQRKPTFLTNVGLVSSRTKATISQLQFQLDAERAGKHELHALVHNFHLSREQSEADKNNTQEQMQATREDIKSLKKNQETVAAILQKLVAAVASKDATG